MGTARKKQKKKSPNVLKKKKKSSAVECFSIELGAKSQHAFLLENRGKVGRRWYMQQIPGVRERCRECGSPTRVCGGTGIPCVSRGGIAQPCLTARMGAVP